jgi:hypothetical protein
MTPSIEPDRLLFDLHELIRQTAIGLNDAYRRTNELIRSEGDLPVPRASLAALARLLGEFNLTLMGRFPRDVLAVMQQIQDAKEAIKS